MSYVKNRLDEERVIYANRIFNIAFWVFMLKALYAYSELIPHNLDRILFNISNLTVFSLCLYKILFLQKYRARQIFIIVIYVLSGFNTDQHIHTLQFLPAVLLLVSTQDVDIKKTISIAYKLEAVFIGIHVAVYPFFYFFMPYAISYTYRGVGNTEPRHQFFLQHANVFSMLLLWTLIGYLYVNYEKLTKLKIITVGLIYVFFHRFTDSNSGMMILSSMIIILLLKDLVPRISEKVVDFSAKYLFSILGAFFTWMMVSLPSLSGPLRDIWISIDGFFTGRCKYGAYAYSKIGFTLFGQGKPVVKKEFWQGFWIDGLPADNTYMFLGVIFGLIYMFFVAYVFWRFTEKAKFEEKLVIIAYSLYTMMEYYVTYVYFCFALFIVMQYVWKEKDNTNKSIFLKHT